MTGPLDKIKEALQQYTLAMQTAGLALNPSDSYTYIYYHGADWAQTFWRLSQGSEFQMAKHISLIWEMENSFLLNSHASKFLVGKWPLTTKPDDGVIFGFCLLAMPSAASQLISLDLFSSGQRNGFDLASSWSPRLRANGLNCRV